MPMGMGMGMPPFGYARSAYDGSSTGPPSDVGGPAGGGWSSSRSMFGEPTGPATGSSRRSQMLGAGPGGAGGARHARIAIAFRVPACVRAPAR